MKIWICTYGPLGFVCSLDLSVALLMFVHEIILKYDLLMTFSTQSQWY